MIEKNRPRIKPRIHEWIVAYSFIREKFADGLWSWLASLPAHAFGRLQPQTGEELSALMLSMLDQAFKAEL